MYLDSRLDKVAFDRIFFFFECMCVSYLGIGERDFGLARIAPSYQLMVFFWFLLSFLVCFFFGVAATAGSSLLTQPLREESGNNKEEEEDDENLKK